MRDAGASGCRPPRGPRLPGQLAGRRDPAAAETHGHAVRRQPPGRLGEAVPDGPPQGIVIPGRNGDVRQGESNGAFFCRAHPRHTARRSHELKRSKTLSDRACMHVTHGLQWHSLEAPLRLVRQTCCAQPPQWLSSFDAPSNLHVHSQTLFSRACRSSQSSRGRSLR